MIRTISKLSYSVRLPFAWGYQLMALELESYRLYRSAYFLGRGDTGIADADNHEAILYNPAGLALGKGLIQRICIRFSNGNHV